jgi:hypothetical protein
MDGNHSRPQLAPPVMARTHTTQANQLQPTSADPWVYSEALRTTVHVAGCGVCMLYMHHIVAAMALHDKSMCRAKEEERRSWEHSLEYEVAKL